MLFVGPFLDLAGKELRRALIQTLASAPSSPGTGQLYNDSTKGIGLYNGTSWEYYRYDQIPAAGIQISQLATNPLARANHTGTQLASTISDFDTQVRTNRLDQMSAPSAAVSANSQKITNLQTGTNTGDAVNKGQMDSAIAVAIESAASGIDSKPSCRAVSVADITLSGAQTIDGVSVIAGDRVLVTGQTTATQNGSYVAAAGAWSRSTDANSTGEITPGAFWFIEEGTTYGGSQWRCANSGTITIGSTNISILQFGAASLYSAGNGMNLVGTAFSVKPDVTHGSIAVTSSGVKTVDGVVARVFAADIGNNSLTDIVVTHNLNSRDVHVEVVEKSSPYAAVIADVERTSVNTVTVKFGTPPTTNQYRAIVIG
jgi:hypothetical protein